MVLMRFHEQVHDLWAETRGFFEESLFSDLAIRTSDGQSIYVHKLIIAAASPMLRCALPDLATDEMDCIILPDFSKQAVLEFLFHLYGTIEPDSCHNFPHELLKCFNVDFFTNMSSGSSYSDNSDTFSSLRDDRCEKKVINQRTKSLQTSRRDRKSKINSSYYQVHKEEFSPPSPETVTEAVEEAEKSDDNNEKGFGETDFHCDHCSKSFKHEKVFRKHLKRHQNVTVKVYTCDMCLKSFNSRSTLHYHRQKHKTPSLQCSECEKTFKSFKGLRQHGIVHSGGVTAHQCLDCGKSFVTQQKLVNHRRSVHTFEKPYICDQCGQGFARSDKMVVHKRRAHTGEKPFKCEKCNWCGVDSSALIHHRRKHVVQLNVQSKVQESSNSPSLNEISDMYFISPDCLGDSSC